MKKLNKIPSKEKGNPLVSVIIPTFNSEKHMERCLKSIKNQTYKNIEIIVVDQSSPDKTVEIAKKFTNKIIIRDKPKFYSPPSLSRNLGAKKSKGEFLLNLDSDQELHPKLIENCVNIIKNKGYVALIIHEKDMGLNFWSKCRALEKEAMINDPYMEVTRLVTKRAFNKIGGYDTNIESGEDWDITARIKKVGAIGYANFIIVHHTGKKHLLKNFKKMFDYGRTFGEYIKKNNELAGKQLTPFRLAYIRNWKLFARRPILTIGFVILKFSEFLGAFMGLIFDKLNRTLRQKVVKTKSKEIK